MDYLERGVKQDSSYTTTDGKIFQDQEESQEHQTVLNITESLKDKFKEISEYKDDVTDPMSHLIGFMIENKEEIVEILQHDCCKTIV